MRGTDLGRVLLLLLPLLAGCASPLLEYQLQGPAAILQPVGSPSVGDGRPRFREIFCTLLERERSGENCQDYLHHLGDEAPPQTAAPLPDHDPRLRLLIVPGAMGECFGDDALPYPRAVAKLRQFDYKIDYLRVDGRSGTANNAAQIAEQLLRISLDDNEKLVLVGYSKGVSDTLQALADYPETAAKVTALASVAGSINGSPLANRYAGLFDLVLGHFPFNDCGLGDGQVVTSLQRDRRMSHLARHPPPTTVSYYSLGSFTEAGHIARLMRLVGHPDLSRADPRNDGQTLYHDQVIPGSTLLGYLNADHWAAAIPMEEAKSFVAGNSATTEPFPRWVVFEALVLYLVESLNVPN